MLKLYFTGPFGSEITLGPADFFRVEGATILSGRQNEPVAQLNSNNQWDVHGRFFTRYDANASLQVMLIDGSEEFHEGPFETLFAAGNMKYADDQPFAHFDHSARCWREWISNRCWPTLLLCPMEFYRV